MSTKQIQRKEIVIHDFDKGLDHTLKAVEKLSAKNSELIKKYDKEMVRNSLAKGTRLKHLLIVLNLTRLLDKDWEDATKQDIKELVFQFIQKYSPNGKETHHTWDHKKILKIFFRWIKFGSREYRDVGNPEETKWIHLNRVKSNIVREQLITDDDMSAILKACINPRDKAFFDVHYEAGTRPGEILSLRIKNVKFAFEQSNSILQKTTDFVSEHKFLTNWIDVRHQGWKLPASDEPHDWCGLWKTIGCNNADLHEKLGKGRLTYVKQFRRSCYRAVCKSCYTKWIARQANVSTRRIERYFEKSKQKPIHLILAVPHSQYYVPVKLLRQRMSYILKLGNIHGAAVVFHPFKFRKTENRWYAAPHFHLVGFGKSSDIKNAFGRYGWYVKEAGERDSVFQTFCYLFN